jgi:PKD repeat protein
MNNAMRRMSPLLVIILLSNLLVFASAQAAASTSKYILLYLNQNTAFVGKDQVKLDTPTTIIDGKMYVPARFLGDSLGFGVTWDPATYIVTMTPIGTIITLDSINKKVYVNGAEVPFNTVAAIVNGSLLVKLTWVMDYLGAAYTYNDELRRVEIQYAKPSAVSSPNATQPVAKFSTDKAVYRMGEPVSYVDLSYDPGGKKIIYSKWSGNKEAFFASGTYPVTLQVTNSAGMVSATYTAAVTVSNETYLSEFEYPFYTMPVGGVIKTDWYYIWTHFDKTPELPKKVTESHDRKLLVSDSPEEIVEKGIVYQETINGKARLYADHLNMTNQKLIYAIMATNNTDKPITLSTTNKGEVYPSKYANIIGSEASVEFLQHNPISTQMVIPPKMSYVYAQLPDYYPTQGTNLIYDVESSGELQISFLATDKLSKDTLSTLPLLSNGMHVRGTFPIADVKWDVDGSSFNEPSRIVIGNGTTDPFVKGYDAVKKQETTNFGNWGMDYRILIAHPRKMALMIVAKGGYFKGPIKINNEIILIPKSGVLTAFNEMQVLAKTTGTEDALDIEFTPPAGSNFPIDLILYPLNELK